MKKGHFVAPPNQISFFTVSEENIFFKTQVTRLGAVVAPNKGLEYFLSCFYFLTNVGYLKTLCKCLGKDFGATVAYLMYRFPKG